MKKTAIAVLGCLSLPMLAAAGSMPAQKTGIMRNAPVECISARQTESTVSRNASELPRKLAPNPSKITDEGVSVFIWNRIGTGENPRGYYEFVPGGMELKWADKIYEEKGFTAQNGFYADGKVYTFSGNAYGDDVFSNALVQYDPASGNVLSYDEWDIANDPYFFRVAYNSNDGYIYSRGWSPTYDGGAKTKVMMRAPLSNPKDVEVICPATDNLVLTALTVNEAENVLYGVNSKGNFIRIGLDGSVTDVLSLNDVLASTNCQATFYAGLSWSPVDGCFYYSPTGSSTYMIKIDAEAKTAECLCELKESSQVAFSITTDIYQKDPLCPLAPEIISVSFPDGATTGSIDFRMPTLCEDGSTITAAMTAVAMVDDVVVGTYNVTAGDVQKVEYTDIATGLHNFTMTAEVDGHVSKAAYTRFFVGKDTPKAPTNVRLTTTGVLWDAVTEGFNKGYIDLTNLKYSVKINNVEYGITTGEALAVTLPLDEPFTRYVAEVTAYYDEYSSAPGLSSPLLAGAPWATPYSVAPTAEQAGLVTVIDGNEDMSVWTFENNMFTYSGSIWGTPNDDWLILPPVAVSDPAKYLSVSLEGMRKGASTEILEVYAGTEPTAEAMTIPVIAAAELTDNFLAEEGLLMAPAAGGYYIGIHAISQSDGFGMNVRNIKVTNNDITANSPAAPVINSVTAGAEGALNAKVDVTLPMKRLDGSSLSATDVLTLYVNGNNTSVTGTPGQTVSADIVSEQGVNRVFASVNCSGNVSPQSHADVYCGLDIPNPPTGVHAVIAPDMMSVTYTWDPVTTGVHGGYVDPSTVVYDFYEVFQTIFGDFAAPMAMDITGCTYTYTLEEGTLQNLRLFGIGARNSAGGVDSYGTAQAFVGTPYPLPMEINFADGYTSVEPLIIYTPSDMQSNGYWTINTLSNFNPEIESNENALGYVGSDGDTGMIGLPRFSTKSVDNADLSIELYTGDTAAGTMVLGQVYGMDGYYPLGTLPTEGLGSGMHRVTFPIPAEYMGQDWVQLILMPRIEGSKTWALYSHIDVLSGSGVSLIGNDSAAGIAAIDGNVILRGHAGEKYVVSDALGRVVATGIADEETSVAVAKGLYMVRCGKAAARLLVK